MPIYYESRIAKLGLNASDLPKLDAEFEEITEGEELTKKESRAAWDAARLTERSAARRVQEPRGGDCINLKTKWAALEALVGDPKLIALIAADLVAQLTPSPPALSGGAQRFALSVSVGPLAFLGCNKEKRRRLANRLTDPLPRGGFALRAAYRQFACGYLHCVPVVSPPASRFGSRTARPRSAS